MRGLVYSSIATVEFSEADLKWLAQTSIECNAQLEITGYLYYDKRRFMQYIEGDKEAINTLMDRIQNDPRHHIQRMVIDDTMTQQRFPSWHMQWLKQGSLAAIRLEHILYDFMLLKTSPSTDYSSHATHIWRLVDKISTVQARWSITNAA